VIIGGDAIRWNALNGNTEFAGESCAGKSLKK